MGYTTPKIEQHLSLIFSKRKGKLLFELEKKESKKTEKFSKITRVDEPEQIESEQCKQRKYVYQNLSKNTAAMST